MEDEQIGSSMLTVSCVLFTSGRQVTIRAKRPRAWKNSSFTRSRKVLILSVVICKHGSWWSGEEELGGGDCVPFLCKCDDHRCAVWSVQRSDARNVHS